MCLALGHFGAYQLQRELAHVSNKVKADPEVQKVLGNLPTAGGVKGTGQGRPGRSRPKSPPSHGKRVAQEPELFLGQLSKETREMLTYTDLRAQGLALRLRFAWVARRQAPAFGCSC